MTLSLPKQVELKIVDPRLQNWGLPSYQTPQAAAMDLTACIDKTIQLWPDSKPVLIPAGFAMHINDPNIAAFIHPRSGRGHKDGLVLGNGTGVLDGDYMGQVMISAWNRNSSGCDPITIEPGERIAQMVFTPIVRVNWGLVEEFSAKSERGEFGFGSTGISP